MILSTMFAATILLADVTPAAAAAATSPPAAVSPAAVTAKTPPPAANKPRVVCKTEAVTGSMFPKKTCYTVDDLAQRRQEERLNLQRMQSISGPAVH